MARPSFRGPGGAPLSSALALTSRSSRICAHCTYRLASASKRQFATTPGNKAVMAPASAQRGSFAKQKPTQSFASQLKNVTKAQMGNDFGRIPDTMIVPLTKDLPRWLGPSWKKRAQIEWYRIKNSVRGFITVFHFNKWDTKKDPLTGKSLRRKMYLSDRLALARDLQTQLYGNIAAGDLKALRKITCDGLYEYCRARIAQRESKGITKEEWKLVTRPGLKLPRVLERWPLPTLLPFAPERVISDRMVMLPKRDSYLRQVVIRITSIQHLRRMEGKVNRFEDSVQVTENLVLQKVIFNGEEGPWTIWGTVDASSPEEIDKLLDKGKSASNNSSWMEDIRNRIGAASGL